MVGELWKRLLDDQFFSLSYVKYGLVEMESTSPTYKSTTPRHCGLVIFLALCPLNRVLASEFQKEDIFLFRGI